MQKRSFKHNCTGSHCTDQAKPCFQNVDFNKFPKFLAKIKYNNSHDAVKEQKEKPSKTLDDAMNF